MRLVHQKKNFTRLLCRKHQYFFLALSSSKLCSLLCHSPNFRTLSSIYFNTISKFWRSGVSHSNKMHLIVNLSKIDSPIHQEENSSLSQTWFRKYSLVIKAAVTCWLSHGKAAQWVLDQYMFLVNAIYEQKSDLISHKLLHLCASYQRF